MLSLPSEIHFWGTNEELVLKDTDFNCKKFVLKKDQGNSIVLSGKKSYFEKRGLIWTPLNKRPVKLKDKLRELEELLFQNKVIASNWVSNSLSLILSRGVLITITLNAKTNEIDGISFDRSLCSKLQNEFICNAILTQSQIIFTTSEGLTFGQGTQWHQPWSIETGPSRRNLSSNSDLLAVWGKTGSEQPQPWAPLTKTHQNANIHLYWIGARGPDYITYKKTDGELLNVLVSNRYMKNIIIVEQKVSQKGSVSIEISEYELIQKTSLKRVAITAVPLQTQVSCIDFTRNETKLILGCIDGTIAILDRNKLSTKIAKASFIPKFVCFNSDSVLAVISNEKGQIQYFDTALNSVSSKLMESENDLFENNLNLSVYFSNSYPCTIDSVNWKSKDLLIIFEQGPLAFITHTENSLTFLNLTMFYLTKNKINQAINLLLSSSEFNDTSFVALQRIVNYLLRLPLSEEIALYLKRALGCFHCPEVPLNVGVRHRFGPQVKAMTRRFFHQLVRSGMYETAFLLAVDLGHHDLFMDLYYIAVQIGETEMAAAARAQASALLSRCSSEGSYCSRSSCSQCSDSSSSEGEEETHQDRNSPENIHMQRTSFLTSTSFSSHNNSDNYLTTNFNTAVPKTVKSPINFSTYIPPIPNIDLPKINFSKPPTVTNKPAPQQSTNTTQLSNQPVFRNVPPIPVIQPNSTLHSQLGIPTVSFPNYLQNRIQNVHSFNTSFLQKLPEQKVQQVAPPIPPPPLPNSTTSFPTTNQNNIGNSGPPKKQQAKVKFSDTVTAFIVPEVKRPVRPPLPAHLMDPQKELADSLPLCHPNEDYLKDFTPVRKNEGSEGGPQSAPKIKVVHFGVV